MPVVKFTHVPPENFFLGRAVKETEKTELGTVVLPRMK
jgi:hypothetical protein